MANIHTRGRSGFIRRGGVKRRETVWVGIAQTQTGIVPSTAVLLGSLNAAALALRPFTVVRTRGLLGILSDQVTGTEDQACSYGHAVVSDQASAIGVTAIPTPVVDQASDLWYVFENMMSDIRFASGVGFGKIGIYKDFDSKAMRKVDVGQDVVTVVETPAVAFTDGIIFNAVGRFLVKLH